MKLIVHAGTGTIIDADDGVYLIDTDSIHDEALASLLEDADESEVVDIAVTKGRRLNSETLEMTHRNVVAFSPTALRYEVEENLSVASQLGDTIAQWARTANAIELDKVAEFIMNDELLWEHYTNIVADAIKAVYKLTKEESK